MKNKGIFAFLLLLILIFMGTGYGIYYYVDDIFIGIISVIILSIILTGLIYRKFSSEKTRIVEETGNSSDINDNLKTQVEISTKVFNICEKLNAASQESLTSTETIASSVEVADSNTIEQSNMLNDTNELTNEVFLSLNNMEKNISDKTEFISRSITAAQKSMENIKTIEERINQSKAMTEDSAEKTMKVKDYTDKIVGLIDLINSISKETNMLSLNASIEAARAGEHGKGFAIVAQEVGKLAKQTEDVSHKIEEVINTLNDAMLNVTDSMKKDMNYMEENCSVIETINGEFENIIGILNTGKDSLEDITNVTKENNTIISQVNINIEKATSFSQEIASHMQETTVQVMEQDARAKELQQMVGKIRDNVYDMQQFVAGKIMEEKMLKQAYYIRDYLKNKQHIDDELLHKLLKETRMDVLYITNSSGEVEYTNEESGIGLNLYEADSSFTVLKEGLQEYVVTPIKIRVEDGKLFKFLTVVDEKKRLYEVGLSLESLLNEI